MKNASTSRVCPIQLLVSLYLGQINYFPIRLREKGEEERMAGLVKQLNELKSTNQTQIGLSKETNQEKMEYHPYKDETEMRKGSQMNHSLMSHKLLLIIMTHIDESCRYKIRECLSLLLGAVRAEL